MTRTDLPLTSELKNSDELLKSLPPDVITRAKLLTSSLLLPRTPQNKGGIALDMECGTGTLTAAMAALQPHLHFIGIDASPDKITRARKNFTRYNLPNLTFETGDITTPRRPDNSVDAIINARVLGEVFTRNQYDDTRLTAMLQTHLQALRPDGLMLIYDYPMPKEGEFVQIEFPVPERTSRHFRLYGTPLGITQGEREIALLEWFAQNARPQNGTNHDIRGFYLEELPPHVPYTRLFRLPAKWAYEFIIRKQHLRAFKSKISHQYTAFSADDLSRIITRDLGARLLYTTPWYDQHVIRTHFDGAFRLYSANGKPRFYPPTGQIYVAQKIPSQSTAALSELRPSQTPATSLSIHAVTHEDNGQITDLITRQTPTLDIIPFYQVSGQNHQSHQNQQNLCVILQKDAHKPLANTIPRAGTSLDGKYWSGHMPAPLTLPQELLPPDTRDNANNAAKIMHKHFGLRTVAGATFLKGPMGYASPSMLDELSQTLFIEIEPPHSPLTNKQSYLAQDILRATACGLIPSAWLDIQMQALLRKSGHPITPWLHEAIPLSYDPPPADQLLRAGKILRQKPAKPHSHAHTHTVPEPLAINVKRWVKTAGKFRPIRGRAGQIAALRSSFIEQDTKGRPLNAAEHDFAWPGNDMQNIAAILPLTEDHQGNTLVGFEFAELPVPSRFGQSEAMMNLPTLPLPAYIDNMEDARSYIAEQFGVETSRVAKMGESFFTQIDLTPQRVFPFCLTRYPRRRNMRMRYTTLEYLLDLIDPDYADSFLWYWGMAYARMCQDTKHTFNNWAPRQEVNTRKYTQKTPNTKPSLRLRKHG